MKRDVPWLSALPEPGCAMDGTKDAGIAAAPTEVGIEPLADFGVGGPGSPFQQGNRGKDHARGAITALEGLFVQERLLDGVELSVAGQPLDGEDGTAGGLFDREGACVFAVAIHEHGAGAALPFAAAVLGAGEFEVFAEDLQERSIWFGADRVALAVDGEFKLAFHGSIPASRGTGWHQAIGPGTRSNHGRSEPCPGW